MYVFFYTLGRKGPENADSRVQIQMLRMLLSVHRALPDAAKSVSDAPQHKKSFVLQRADTRAPVQQPAQRDDSGITFFQFLPCRN